MKAFLFLLSGILVIQIVSQVLLGVIPAKSEDFVWSTKLDANLDDSEIIILGDSQAMSGLIPSLVGKKIYNFSMPSLQFEGMEHLYSKKIKHSSVKEILLVINPFMIYKNEVVSVYEGFFKEHLINDCLPFSIRCMNQYHPKSAGDILDAELHRLPMMRLHSRLPQYFSFPALLSEYPFEMIRQNPDLIGTHAMGKFLSGPVNPFDEMKLALNNNAIIEQSLSVENGFWVWKDFQVPDPGVFARLEDPREISRVCERSPLDTERISEQKLRYTKRTQAIESMGRLLQQISNDGRKITILQIPLSIAWESSTYSDDVYHEIDQLVQTQVETLRKSEKHRQIRLINRAKHDVFRTSNHNFHDLTHLSLCGAYDFSNYIKRELNGK